MRVEHIGLFNVISVYYIPLTFRSGIDNFSWVDMMTLIKNLSIFAANITLGFLLIFVR